MKIVQIGTGGWGKNHARILSELGVLVAVCDTSLEKSKEFGEKYSVNHYESLDELINSEEFDGAFVITPTSTHVEITMKLLEAKKHVFVEKPLCLNRDELAHIEVAAKESGIRSASSTLTYRFLLDSVNSRFDILYAWKPKRIATVLRYRFCDDWDHHAARASSVLVCYSVSGCNLTSPMECGICRDCVWCYCR